MANKAREAVPTVEELIGVLQEMPQDETWGDTDITCAQLITELRGWTFVGKAFFNQVVSLVPHKKESRKYLRKGTVAWAAQEWGEGRQTLAQIFAPYFEVGE